MKNLIKARSLRAVAILTALLVLGTACGSDSAETATTTTNDSPEEVAPTTDAVATDSGVGVVAAQWADNVEITMGDDVFRFQSNGLPDHELPDQFLVPIEGNMPPFDGDNIEDEFYVADTADLIVESPIDVEITLTPVYSDEITQTGLSTIGVMISGAQLFNDYEDQSREFIALDDNLSLGGAFFIDACNGHPLASGSSYHYHGVPYCITDTVDVAGEHSTIIGILLDGFGIYGPQDVDGSTLTNSDLDECSGHVGVTPDSDEAVYHYHLTEDASPYSIDCFHGEIDYSGNAGGGPGGGAAPGDAAGDAAGGPGGPPDFTDAAATLGVTVQDLTAALGQPPFDLDAAAATLGVTVSDLEAALPAPPGGGGPAPEQGESAAEDTGDTDTDTATSAAPDADELATRSDVALAALWADNVAITIDGATMVFESDGLPAHEYLDVYLADGRDGKYIAGGVDGYAARFEIPLVPVLAESPSETGNGAIGVAISGAVFFDPYEGNGSATVANDDNETIDGIPFIDACGGHPLPNGSSYHYHGIPFCITDAIDTPGEHSIIIGYLFDGFPIYGPQDIDGDEPTDLDECLGHTGATPEFDTDTYHYHVTSIANYISECLAGIT